MNGPLSGIRVLTLSQMIAGPFGSMLLGDMEAEIIKIELWSRQLKESENCILKGQS